MAKKSEIAKYVLGAIAVTGVIIIAVAAPNLFSAFGQLGFVRKKPKRFDNKQIYRSLYNLERTGRIAISYQDGKMQIKLTKNGKEKLLKFRLEDMVLKRPKKWDKKWRLIIFDIPEKFKVNRNMFVAKLKELGFIQLQRSVWVSPYECENEIDFIKEIYLIRPFVRIVRAEAIDIESDLVTKFSLNP